MKAAVDPDEITTGSLEALQSDGQRKILDIVDDLRRQGLSGIVGLPQLVVCGDQSSGKSSVLEAITEIPFPRNENLCTRFATEIILRRHVTASISIRITPDKARPDDELQKLVEFTRTITDFDELPTIIEEATALMGLKEIGKDGRAFAKDVLTVEISGPNRPQLTLVDLPGLIQASNKMQSEEDVSLIKELVLEYMKSPRTIILAVVSAKNDFANQIITKYCRDVDPKGHRTLGIITKPDILVEGTKNQQNWLDIAQNRDVYFELGWHIVKNRSELEGDKSFSQRNAAERQFFSRGKYADLSAKNKGIESLRNRLSTVLQNHLKTELPKLRTELLDKMNETNTKLQTLGIKRSTVLEQRMFLTDIGQRINEILKAAIKGQYEYAWFGPVNMQAAVDSHENIRRFRAVIQHLNLRFADIMHRNGHKYAIPPGKDKGVPDTAETNGDGPALPQPKKMTREKGIEWVHHVLERSRGLELPGNFNPLIISQLFWEQSTPWNDIAMQHIEKVFDMSKAFVELVLGDAAPADIKPRISDLCVEQAMQAALASAKEELGKIIEDKGRHPMTYNHYFTTKIQDSRKSKYAQILASAAKAAQVSWTKEETGVVETYIDPGKLEKDLQGGIEQDMDKFSAEDALDSEIAYYADELKYFIDCVTKQVIERHLVDPLSRNVLSPRVIAGLTDEQISLLTAEAPEVTHQRDHLEGRKQVLENGLKIFKEALGGFA
ncbi:GTP-binding protein [Sporormia fimetaria CBS 119925]|uniref:GTP-binding protein n=1 Tax=Sporormia fimetaria CBS 119925 TaxID=1340428 RepID=A0A6A6VIA8_9PLEO|nr:GTP-binding protein [Sporormia fimetaria CBS 119925]